MQTLCKNYPAALQLISKLLTEVKQLDDKLLLTEIHMLESKVHSAVRNISKARAALTVSRISAHSSGTSRACENGLVGGPSSYRTASTPWICIGRAVLTGLLPLSRATTTPQLRSSTSEISARSKDKRG